MTQITWIETRLVTAIHDLQLIEHGGPEGVRDTGLLDSALAKPQQLESYGRPDRCDLAAAYTAGIVRNHPFVDGNKRTGFVVGVLFLELNGLVFTADEAEAVSAVVSLAASEISDSEYADWLRANCEKPG